MGKKTLYHPVSLHVIRGAAEYCGFQFGTIKQKWNDPEKRTARYDVEIKKMPDDLMKTGTLLGIHHDLQNCFMDDIRVHWVHMTQSGQWACQLAVGIPAGDAGLIPNPEPSIEPIPAPSRRGGGGGGEPDADRFLPMLLKLREIVERNNFVVLDTETTGLKRPCEIIDISIIDCSGTVLLNTLLKPRVAISPFIADLTGITNEMVAGQRTWPGARQEVLDIIEGRDILVYNATFDRHMMHCSDDMWELPKREYKSDVTNWFCVMETYAEYFGQWNEYYGSYRWQKLGDAMDQQKLLRLEAHRANADATMTMWLIYHMCQM